MARNIKNNEPQNVDDALYLHSRGLLATPSGVKNRDQLRAAFEETYGESAEGSDDEDISSYDDLSVAQLREELAERELPTGGNKGELVARLEEDDAAEEDE